MTAENEVRTLAVITEPYIENRRDWQAVNSKLLALGTLSRGFRFSRDGKTWTITTVVTDNQSQLDTAEQMLQQLERDGCKVVRHSASPPAVTMTTAKDNPPATSYTPTASTAVTAEHLARKDRDRSNPLERPWVIELNAKFIGDELTQKTEIQELLAAHGWTARWVKP